MLKEDLLSDIIEIVHQCGKIMLSATDIERKIHQKAGKGNFVTDYTRGIDVGAKNEIYKLMNRLAEEGKSIIMISSEMTEILRMSDRIVVMCEGRKTGEIDISEASQEIIMNMATREI